MGFTNTPGRRILSEYVLPQISFWANLNTVQALYVFLFLKSMLFALGIPAERGFGGLFAFGIGLAVFHGAILGAMDYTMNQLYFIGKSVSRIVILQSVLSLGVFILTFYGIRRMILEQSVPRFAPHEVMDDRVLRDAFWILLLHYSVGSMTVSFASHIVKKYGQDVIMPMLLGAYRRPQAENRIFMFMDLKSSTTLAEQLGHLRYSRLVQAFIIDVNRFLSVYKASIYQYAGDEIVITWRHPEKQAPLAVAFYFACKAFVEKRRDFYLKQYGAVPEFKAGMDCGVVTAVEIGDVKRDIAYHGDTLNTASRIQSLCNAANKPLLVSQAVINALPQNGYLIEPLGPILLKGKENTVEVYAVSETAASPAIR